jgi:hypothetical protein
MGYLPEGYDQIQNAYAADSAAHPARRYHWTQALQAHLLRSVEQEKVVAPIAQPKRRQKRQDVNPRQEGQHEADFQAQDNVEDDSQSCRHIGNSK